MKVFAIVLLAFVALFQISSAEYTEWIIEGGHGIPTKPPPCKNIFEGLTEDQKHKMDEVFTKMRENGQSKRPECHGQAYLQSEQNI